MWKFQLRHLILLYPDKKYICVDNDEKLIQVYNDIIEDDKYNNILNNLKNTEIKTKEEYNIFKKINTTESYIYYHSIYTLRPGLLNFIKVLNNCNCKIIAVLWNHTLLEYFYKHFDLNIKFTTEIKFLNHNKLM